MVNSNSCSCLCVARTSFSQFQIYEDSIVIRSVFESARQRIVTSEVQKETVSASHSNNGGGAEDQFVPSAGGSQNTNESDGVCAGDLNKAEINDSGEHSAVIKTVAFYKHRLLVVHLVTFSLLYNLMCFLLYFPAFFCFFFVTRKPVTRPVKERE